jgi:hypothetical protein
MNYYGMIATNSVDERAIIQAGVSFRYALPNPRAELLFRAPKRLNLIL